MVRKYMAKEDSPAMAKLLDGVSITPNSSSVEVSLDATDDPLHSLLLQRNLQPRTVGSIDLQVKLRA
jgi:hypothetical protein